MVKLLPTLSDDRQDAPRFGAEEIIEIASRLAAEDGFA
jgi:hypothetical protein